MNPQGSPKGEYRSAQREGTPTIAIADDSRLGRFASLYCKSTALIDKLQPLLLLGFRLYVARVFFLSGLTKLHDWSVTLALFTCFFFVVDLFWGFLLSRQPIPGVLPSAGIVKEQKENAIPKY